MTEMTKELHWPELTTEEFIRTGDLDDIPGAATPREVSELIIRLRKAEAALEAASAELQRLRRPRASLHLQDGTVQELVVNWSGPQGIMINGRMFPAQDSEIAKYVDDPIEGGTA